jgi:hypothetical protein
MIASTNKRFHASPTTSQHRCVGICCGEEISDKARDQLILLTLEPAQFLKDVTLRLDYETDKLVRFVVFVYHPQFFCYRTTSSESRAVGSGAPESEGLSDICYIYQAGLFVACRSGPSKLPCRQVILEILSWFEGVH